MRRSRRVLLQALGATAGLCVAACLSPTLPLPPPEVPEVQQIGEGQYRLTGTIPIPGKVIALDVRSRLLFGKIVDDAYQLDIPAHPGDLMRVYYESGDDVSDYAEFVIEERLVPPPAAAADAAAPPAPPAPDAAAN